jgi:quercetin dioxygenase-like cupin family protein
MTIPARDGRTDTLTKNEACQDAPAENQFPKGGLMHWIGILGMEVVACAPMLAVVTGTSPSLDPAVVNAGMEHVRLENASVRVIEGVLRPGDREQMHSHPAFVTYVIEGGRIRNNFADGRVVEAELKTGDVLMREPQTHWIENIGDTTIRFLVFELRTSATGVRQ